MIGLGLSVPERAVAARPPIVPTNRRLLADGVSFRLLEDGISKRLTEQ